MKLLADLTRRHGSRCAVMCKVALLSAVLVSALSGCATYLLIKEAPENPKLDLIVVGAARTVVERELGKPVQTENNVVTYEYFISRFPGGGMLVFLPVSLLLDYSGISLALIPQVNRIVRVGTHRQDIVYGPSDRVIALSHQSAQNGFLTWLHSAQPEKDLTGLAYAANQGYAPAQFTQAMRYRYGLWNTEVNPVRAYTWAQLAAFGGHQSARGTLDDWAKTMAPDQVAEAERLFRAWEPERATDIQASASDRATEIARSNRDEQNVTLPGVVPGGAMEGTIAAPSAGELADGTVDVMLLGVSARAVEIPAFVSAQNLEAAAGEAVKLAEKEFPADSHPGASTAMRSEQTRLQSICLISSDGRIVELDFSRSNLLGDSSRSQVTAAFRADVVAVMRNDGTWSGGYVCGLQRAVGWPPELRSKVTDFIQRIKPAP